MVVNEFFFAAYYKTGEIQVFERNEETFFLQDCFVVWGDSPAEHLYRSMVMDLIKEHVVSMVSDGKERIFVIVDKLECIIERHFYK